MHLLPSWNRLMDEKDQYVEDVVSSYLAMQTLSVTHVNQDPHYLSSAIYERKPHLVCSCFAVSPYASDLFHLSSSSCSICCPTSAVDSMADARGCYF